ncbi:MAG: PEP-CTERM sorting domain-containing protein [Opitutales bacterium]
MKKTLASLSGLALLAPAFAVIDFEAIGGVVGDNNTIPASENFVDGNAVVRFWFDTDSTPDGVFDAASDELAVIEAVGAGDTGNGFRNNVLSDDSTTTADDFDTENAADAGRLDNFFLRTSGELIGRDNPPTLIIDYSQTSSSFSVFEASGDIFDIDGRLSSNVFEAWTVRAYDSTGAEVATVDSVTAPNGPGDLSTVDPVDLAGGSFDGLAWNFRLDTGTTPISFISVSYTGTAPSVGLAFDNFDATAVPEPSALAGLFGLAALLIARRRA